jgi:hypothetical protein
MNRDTHARFLEYRDRFTYFGKGTPLDATAFAAADDEVIELERKGEARDDEEEARYAALLEILLMD